MNIDFRTVHCELSDELKGFIDKRLTKLDYADAYVSTLEMKVSQEKTKMYKVDVTLKFKWGTLAHLSIDGYEIHEEIDKIIDKIDSKIRKEKSKIQSH